MPLATLQEEGEAEVIAAVEELLEGITLRFIVVAKLTQEVAQVGFVRS